MKHLIGCPLEYSADLAPDFLVGKGLACLYLSIRYHRLNPDYIYDRMKALRSGGQSSSASSNSSSSITDHNNNRNSKADAKWKWQLLILHVDVEDAAAQVRELTKLCILQHYALMLAWKQEEVAHILQTCKAYECKPIDSLKERVETDFLSRMIDCLTSIKGVNKTDALTLLTQFGSLQGIVQATADQLAACPGIGPQKCKRIIETFEQPFLNK